MTLKRPRRRPRFDVSIQEKGTRPHPHFGYVLRIMIRRDDGKRMTWSQVHQAFAEAYPNMWALEVFPPEHALIDQINAYHLWVLPPGEVPEEMRIDV